MKSTLKRAFSRPIQLFSYVVVGVATQHMLPDNPDVLSWAAYVLIYMAVLAVGYDNYNEGVERGIDIMYALEGKT